MRVVVIKGSMTPHSKRNEMAKQRMVTGISFHVYELLKLCRFMTIGSRTCWRFSVDYSNGDLLHLPFDGVLELLDGIRLAPVHPVLQEPPEHEVQGRQVG